MNREIDCSGRGGGGSPALLAVIFKASNLDHLSLCRCFVAPFQPIDPRDQGGVPRAADGLELQGAEERFDQGRLEQEPLPGARVKVRRSVSLTRHLESFLNITKERDPDKVLWV